MAKLGRVGSLLVLLGLAVPTLLAFPPPPAAAQDRISFSGLSYLAYENGREGGEGYNQFFVNRAYLTTRVNVLPRLTARLTLDTSQDREGDGLGDMEVRIKYAYAKYDFGDLGPATGVGLEGGIVHMVWLDFEENVNLYRMRDPMFMERSGMFNSADFGLTLTGGLGGSLPDEYRQEVSSSYAARHGSFALGVYNGGGYHGVEQNDDKVLQGRLTLRPLPDALPGLQLSGLAIAGKGNQAGSLEEIPDWRTFNLLASYQHPGGAVSAQYVRGEGNQRGTWTEPGTPDTATDYDGFSFFGEHRLGSRSAWRLVAGYDRLERTPGSLDRSFQRVHGGIGYDLGAGNILLLDFDRREWDDSTLSVDNRVQVVLQVKW